jgi:hypothetical protein
MDILYEMSEVPPAAGCGKMDEHLCICISIQPDRLEHAFTRNLPADVFDVCLITPQGCRAGGGGHPRHSGPRVPPDLHDRRAMGAPAYIATCASQ